MAGANSLRTIYFALCANSAIAVAKFVAAVITGSSAMLAEAVHSTADAGNQLLLLLGIKRSKRPPDDLHPLGYGKTIYFWSFIVAIILFSLGGMFSILEGWHKLHEPEALNWPWLAIGILVFAIIAESISLHAAMKEINKVRYGRNYWRWFRESRQSELIVIFGEDLAALFGLTLALMAVGLTMVTGNPIYDAYGTLAIGALLIIIAILIGIEVKALLIGESIDPREVQHMCDFIKQQDSIETLLNIITLQLGKDVLVTMKIRPQPFASADELIKAINRFEKDFKSAFPQVVWLFVEPDSTES